MIISFFLLLFSFLSSRLVHASSRKVFVICLLMRICIALLNVVSGGSFLGASVDANSFYLKSISNIGSFSIFDFSQALNDGSTFFININSLLQFLNGEPSFFLAHTLSILTSSLCMVLLVKTYFLFPQATLKGSNTLLLLYTLTPSILFYQSYILREASQSLCLLCIIYVSLYSVFRGFSISWLFAFFLSFFCGILLHSAMVMIIFIVTTIGLYVLSSANLIKGPTIASGSNVFPPLLLISVLAILIILIVPFTRFNSSDNVGDLLLASDSYLESSIIDGAEARAQYGKIFSFNNPLSILPSFLFYMLAPIGLSFNPMDLLLGTENFIKLTFFIAYLYRRRYLSHASRNLLDKLILAWFLVNLIWSFGTTNWGTASRHQTIAYSFLLIPFVLTRTASRLSPKSTLKIGAALDRGSV